MKTKVKFIEVNQLDYLGHEIKLVSNDGAEYEAVLNEGDALVDTDYGVCLKRNGELYSQINKMNTFKGVSFKSDDGDVISIKLLKIS